MYQYQVSFTDAIKRALTVNYCNFSGRASRSEYWWFVLATTILNTIFYTPAVIAGYGTTTFNVLYGIMLIIGLALLLPTWGLIFRRLHDTGRSGWNVLWLLLPFIGSIILLVFLVQDSQMEPNQYGPVPNMAE